MIKIKTLKSKLLAGARNVLVVGVSLFGLSGCAEVLYSHPVDKFIIDNFVPEVLLPQSIKDKQARERGEGNITLPPEHVVVTHDGMWRPEQGYTWVNSDPAKNNDYRVRKLPEY